MTLRVGELLGGRDSLLQLGEVCLRIVEGLHQGTPVLVEHLDLLIEVLGVIVIVEIGVVGVGVVLHVGLGDVAEIGVVDTSALEGRVYGPLVAQRR